MRHSWFFALMLRQARKRMPKVMVWRPNRGLFFAGNAGRTFHNPTHPEFRTRG
jgi:hypothetical protein